MASLSQFGLLVLLLHIVSPSKCANLPQKTNTSSDALMNIPARLVALEQTVAIIAGEFQEQRSSSNKKLILKEDIVATINQGSFAIAEEKMLELHDPAIVADIVRDMANSGHDFGVLVNLAKSVNNTSLKTHILTNLYQKAKESDHISTPNLIALAKCLSEKGKGYQNDEVISIRSFKKLLDQIAENTITTFVDAIKWQGDYQTNSKVRGLAADIAEWRDVSQKVMTGLVSRVFGTVHSNKVFKAVSNHTDAWQALVGVDALIERLKDTDSLRGSIALDIASYLNQMAARKNVHTTAQEYARRVKDKIPDCFLKLTSLTTVCFWNRHTKSFLAENTTYYNKLLVSAVLRPRLEDSNTQKRAKWVYQRKDGRFFFRNVHYDERILQASDITVSGFHRVFSTHQQGDLGDKNAWMIEPAGDSCLVKNYWNNEYLFASDVNIAGTRDTGSSSAKNNPKFAWQFVSC